MLMKLVIQRVTRASVSVDSKVVGEIDHGLFILLGVGQEDAIADAERLAEKVSKLRILADSEGKMNRSILETKGSVLVVSQFTLYADISAGNRPSFIKAASGESARAVYDHFVATLSNYGINTKTGEFGAYMKIETELDGPVTIMLS